jgi:hypothetical protein
VGTVGAVGTGVTAGAGVGVTPITPFWSVVMDGFGTHSAPNECVKAGQSPSSSRVVWAR